MSLQVKRLRLATLGAGTDNEWPVHGFLVTYPGGAVLVDTGVGGPQQVLADWRVVEPLGRRRARRAQHDARGHRPGHQHAPAF